MFNDIVKLNTNVLMYKASKHLLPPNIQSLFCRNFDVHKYGTRSKDKMHITSVNSNRKYMSTNIVGVRLWNKLEINVN